MATVFRLPDVGEGLTEADIVNWLVEVGDEVEINDPIVEVETAKSVVELPSPHAGTVTSLLAEPGETVEVGTPIIEFSTDLATENSSVAAQPPAEEGAATLVGAGETKRRSRRALRSRSSVAVGDPVEAPTNNGSQQPTETTGTSLIKLAKPPVRKLAKDLGVDLHQIPATGPIGQVTRNDVLNFVQKGAHVDSAGASPPEEVLVSKEREVVPLKGVRKATADAMIASAFTAPHITEFLDVDVTKMMELIQELREQNLGENVKVSPLTILSHAVCWAINRTPEINARLEKNQIVMQRSVNLGIAAATERGLIVPNIKNAHQLGLVGLARELRQLTTTARAGKTSPSDQTDGTITITNVGVFGVDSGTPILNPGETAIIAFGQIRKRPWVVNNELSVRDVTTLSVSADHRVVDGAEVSTFLADLGRALEDPLTMLL